MKVSIEKKGKKYNKLLLNGGWFLFLISEFSVIITTKKQIWSITGNTFNTTNC